METKHEEQQARIDVRMSSIKHKIVVMSGKGGVGKTTVSVNLAYGLSLTGKKVGLLDIDLHGPNAAKMLGLEGGILSSSNGEIEPFEALHGLKVISMALVLGSPDEPVIWRGPLKTVAIKQFLGDVSWGELDYLIVDSPPGTGDELISICQAVKDIDGAVIVTTPQDVAILDSTKSIMFAKKLNIPVIGIIENMSGLQCPHCGNNIDLFSTGGGEKAAHNFEVPFLGRIPVDPAIVHGGDSGQPFILYSKLSATAVIMNEIVGKITTEVLRKQQVASSEGPDQ